MYSQKQNVTSPDKKDEFLIIKSENIINKCSIYDF